MTYIKINGTQYPATVNVVRKDRAWDDRASKSITLDMDYATANSLFADDTPWSSIWWTGSLRSGWTAG